MNYQRWNAVKRCGVGKISLVLRHRGRKDLQGSIQSHAGKIVGISRADEFSFIRAELEMKKYSGQWCPRLKIMLKEIEKSILAKFNGYCWNGFIFWLDETDLSVTFERHMVWKLSCEF